MLCTLASNAQSHYSRLTSQANDALAQLYKYESNLAKCQDNGLKDIAVLQYSSLLRTKKARELFWEQSGEVLNSLFDILREAVGAGRDTDSTVWNGGTSIRSATDTTLGGGVGLQLLYHVLLAIWQLTFEASLVAKGLER